MPSQSEIVSQIRETLTLTDPELDTSVGSVTRKIIDAVAEAISEAYVDQQILGYTYDIDSKIEGDLDAFVNLFGISRLPGKRASGAVVFARNQSAADQFLTIPVGTQIIARKDAESQPVILQTLTTGFLSIGDTSVSIPVQAVQAGPEANLPAGAVNSLASPISGVATITNPQPITGGTNMESDGELRERWKKTVFRNMAGTEQMYLGLSLDTEGCFAANVIGATKRRREVLQIQSGSATSSNSEAKYVYGGNVYVGRSIDNGDLFVQGLDYSWTNSVPPVVTVLNPEAVPDGTLVEVDYEYVPLMSRNDPEDRITNRIDVWCAGTSLATATQTVVFRPSPVFSSSPDSPYHTGSFVRPDGTRPEANNTFVPLAFGPLISVPDTITAGGTTYGLVDPEHPMGTEANGIIYAYDMVHQEGAFGYSPASLFGLEWDADHRPSSGEALEIEYAYNTVPQNVQRKIDQWRLVGTDARAHQAIRHDIRVNLAVLYSNPLRREQIDVAIAAEIEVLLRQTGLGGAVQPSDILNAVAGVSGVDAVRFQHGGDHSSWDPNSPNSFDVGLQRIVNGNVVESYVDSNGRPLEVRLGDASYPVLGDVRILVRAANNFGAS